MSNSSSSIEYVHKQFERLSSTEKAIEWYKCKMNPFYFIFNYAFIPEIGGVLKYDDPIMGIKIRRFVRSIAKYHKCLLMATRQLGKSTVAGCLLEWACNFYPCVPATILNANKSFALENLEKIKFIHSNLPPSLRTPLKYKGDRKTTMEYVHNSIIRVFYPSSTTSASTLARSLTSPILYVDECAHINHMQDAYTSAQPTLSRAREQARKNNYPFFVILTSTPNGTVGRGQWFYDMYNFAVDSDDIFDNDGMFNEFADTFVNNPERNGFVRVTFHWSEDPDKTQDWYNQQCRDLNFDKRAINQELDLVFVGSTSCIFDDDFLGSLKPTKPVNIIPFPHATHLKLFTDVFDTGDFFLIGADTAKSLTGDFNAIEIFSYSEFIQVGEYFGRLGSLTKYSQVLMEIIKFLFNLVGDRIILCIENNSIGSAIIEDLENADDGFDYMQYLYTPTPLNNKMKDGTLVRLKKQPPQFGINTNSNSKSKMVSFLYDYLTKNPGCVKSSDLINQLNVIERGANGSIRAQYPYHDDIFMAAALCAYIKKLSSLEYESLLGVSAFTHQKQQSNLYRSLIAVNSPSVNTNQIYNEREGGLEYITDESYIDGDNQSSNSDMFSVF